MVNYSDAVPDIAINVGNVGDMVHGVVVVHIRDLNNRDPSVSDVYVLYITRTRAIPRDVNFSRSEWEPTHRSSAHANTESANEGDQRGSINRAHGNWSRDPAPPASYKSPAAIMEWSKTPGFVFNPSPTPWVDVGPVAVAIGSPISRYGTRRPYMTVVRVGLPTTVLVEVLVAGHILRSVLPALALVFTLVPRLAPLSKRICLRKIIDVVAELICT
jgi:hypothetical protein